MESIIKANRLYKALIITTTIFFIVLVTFLGVKYDNIILTLIAFLCLISTFIFVKIFGLETVMLFYILFIPYMFYITSNIFYNNTSMASALNYLEIFLLVVGLIFTVVNNRNFKFGIPEIILVLILFMFNFITYFQFHYSFKVFMFSSVLYLKYSIIILIIFNLKIDMTIFEKVLKLFSIMVIINTTFAVLQVIFGNVFLDPFIGSYFVDIRNGYARCIGIFPWSTELGAWSGLYFILYYFYGKSIRKRYFTIIGILCILNIILAQARLSLILVLIFLLIHSVKKVSNLIKYVTLIFLFVMVLNNFVDIGSFINETVVGYSRVEDAPRLYYIVKGLDIVKDHPLFGIGYDRYGTQWTSEMDNYAVFTKYNIKMFYNGKSYLGTTDSFLAKLLPEFGILGSVLFVALLVIILRKSYKLRKLDNKYTMLLYVVLYSLFYTINQSHSLFNRQMGPIFWVSAGFIIKYYYLNNKKNGSTLSIVEDGSAIQLT